jgi:hypothetical protein
MASRVLVIEGLQDPPGLALSKQQQQREKRDESCLPAQVQVETELKAPSLLPKQRSYYYPWEIQICHVTGLKPRIWQLIEEFVQIVPPNNNNIGFGNERMAIAIQRCLSQDVPQNNHGFTDLLNMNEKNHLITASTTYYDPGYCSPLKLDPRINFTEVKKKTIELIHIPIVVSMTKELCHTFNNICNILTKEGVTSAKGITLLITAMPSSIFITNPQEDWARQDLLRAIALLTIKYSFVWIRIGDGCCFYSQVLRFSDGVGKTLDPKTFDLDRYCRDLAEQVYDCQSLGSCVVLDIHIPRLLFKKHTYGSRMVSDHKKSAILRTYDRDYISGPRPTGPHLPHEIPYNQLIIRHDDPLPGPTGGYRPPPSIGCTGMTGSPF